MSSFNEYNNDKDLYLDLKETIIKKIKDGKMDYIIIVPNNKIKRELEIDIVEELGAVLDLKIFIFDEFIAFNNTTKMEPMSSAIFNKLVLEYSIKECIEEKLIQNNYFYNSTGFSKLAFRFINYLRSSLITADEFKEKVDSDPSLFSIAEIYKKYSENLKLYNVKDRYDIYYKFFEIYDKNSCLKNINNIYLAGFIDFRLIEYEIIKTINNFVDIDVYYYKSIKKVSTIYLETVKFFKNLNFEHYKVSSENVNNNKLTVIKTEDKNLEVKRLIVEIKKNLIKNTTKNHCIVINNKDYLKYILERFKKEKIEIELNTVKSLVDLDFGKFLYMIFNRDVDLLIYIYINLKNSIIFENIIEDYELEKLLKEIKFDSFDEIFNSYLFNKNVKYNEYTFILKKIYEFYTLDNSIEIKKIIIDNLKVYLMNDLNNKEVYDKFYDFINELFFKFEKIIDSLDENDLARFITNMISNFSYYENSSIGNNISLVEFDDYKLLDFDYIYILGCDDKNYPKLEKSNYYFNRNTFNNLKRMNIDLLNSKMIYSRDELNFSNILNSNNSNIYISYESSEEGLISDFLMNYKVDINIEEYSLKDYFKPESKFITNDYDIRLYLSTFNNPTINNNILTESTDRIPKKVNKSKFTVTQLETYLQCPTKYYFKYILELEDQFKNIDDYKSLHIGIACHESLRFIYEKYIIINKIELLTNEEIKAILMREFEKLDYPLETSNAINIVNRYSILLQELIKKDSEFLNGYLNGLKPYKFEESIIIDRLFKINNKEEKIRITGRIDRIDKDDQGKLYLIDYKLGKSSAKKLSDFEKNKTLQFPIYSLIDNIIGCRYLIINNSSVSPFYEIAEVENQTDYSISREKFLKLRNNTIEMIEQIITKIRNDIFFTGTNDKSNCNNCNYYDICEYR